MGCSCFGLLGLLEALLLLVEDIKRETLLTQHYEQITPNNVANRSFCLDQSRRVSFKKILFLLVKTVAVRNGNKTKYEHIRTDNSS